MLLILLLLALKIDVLAQQSYLNGTEKIPDHPRILLLKGEERSIKRNSRKISVWKGLHQVLIAKPDEAVELPVNEYKK